MSTYNGLTFEELGELYDDVWEALEKLKDQEILDKYQKILDFWADYRDNH